MSFSEWKKYQLSEIINLIGGGTPKTSVSEYWNGDIPWLSVVDFGNKGKYVYETEKSITEKGLKESSTKILKKGQLIISARGTVGEVAVLGRDMAFNQSCYGITAKDLSENDFLYYLLKFNIRQLKQNTHGSVFDTLTRQSFESIEVDIPSIETQQRIASILSSLDDALELNQQINKTLEEMAKAIFKEWFVDFNFPNATGKFQETEIGKIPVGWKVYTIGDLVDTISETYKFDKKEKVIFLNTGDILEGEFLHRNYSEIASLPGQAKKSIKRNDILFSEIRPANKRFAFVNFDADEYVVSTKLMVLRSKKVNPLLIYFLLTREEMLKQLQHLAESRSGTFPQITFSQLKDLKIALPNDETLDKFIKYLEAYYSQSKQNIEENQSLINLRDTLLPKLMKGEIEIREKETV
jgi:type I restriction enzyme, S subunit